MNATRTPLSNSLIGSLTTTGDDTRLTTTLTASFEAHGGDPSTLDVLACADDVERCLRANSHLGAVGRLIHRLAMATDDTAAHLHEVIRGEVSLGRTVLIVHGVGRADVEATARRLHAIGAHDLHYAGRWTSNDHGLIPRAAERHAA